MDQDVGEKPSS